MFLEKLFGPGGPVLDWLQVEITTHCRGRGPYSVFNSLRDKWISQHMSWELFESLVPAMARSRLVHLQGWGDPFLHPRFIDMVRLTAQHGALVATASMLPDLEDEYVEAMVQAGVGLFTLHIHDLSKSADGPSDTDKLRQTLERLAEAKARLNSPTPRAVVLATLTRSGLSEVHHLPDRLAGLGVQTLVVNALSFVSQGWPEDEVLVPRDEEEYLEIRTRLRRMANRAAELGMQTHHFLVYGGARPTGCIERPHRAVFISSRGEVSPCIFNCLPLTAPAGYRFQGMDLDFPRLVFGDVGEAPLARIWKHPGYSAFRREFARGRLPEHCQGCWRPYLVPE